MAMMAGDDGATTTTGDGRWATTATTTMVIMQYAYAMSADAAMYALRNVVAVMVLRQLSICALICLNAALWCDDGDVDEVKKKGVVQ